MKTIQRLNHQLYKLFAFSPHLANVHTHAQTTARGRSRATLGALQPLPGADPGSALPGCVTLGE